MSLLHTPPSIRDEKAWYFLSIFYARNAWAELLPHILQFYADRQTQFCNCLISFSEERGEQVQITLISLDCEKNYKSEIEQFFLSFLEKNPSISLKVFPYGNTLWCDYPNNSLAWNTFKYVNYTEQRICFHEKTTQLALQLLDNDFSNDNIFTLALCLTTKGLVRFNPTLQSSTVIDTLNQMMSEFQDYASVESVLQSILEQIDLQYMCETIQSYIKEDSAEYSEELIEWLAEVDAIKQHLNFSYFHRIVCDIIGLSGMYPIFILNLLTIWHNTSPTTSS